MSPSPDGRKRCSHCRTDKPFGDFGAHRGKPDGKADWCRECQRDSDRRRRESPEVRAQQREQTRQRRLDPAVAERDRATSAAWKAKNPERAAATWRTPEKVAGNRAWRVSEAGRLSGRLAAQKRYALARGGSFTAQDWLEVLEEFNHRCAYCLQQAPLQIEHMQPLSRGGPHIRENIVPACRRCNQRKHSKTLLEFAAVACRLDVA